MSYSCLKKLLEANENLKFGDVVCVGNSKSPVMVIENRVGDCVYFKSSTQSFHIFYEEIDLIRDTFIYAEKNENVK